MWWCTCGCWLHMVDILTTSQDITRAYSALPTNPNSPIWTHDTSDLILCRMASKIKMQRTSRKLQVICTNLLTVQNNTSDRFNVLNLTLNLWYTLNQFRGPCANEASNAHCGQANQVSADGGWCDRGLLAARLPFKPFQFMLQNWDSWFLLAQRCHMQNGFENSLKWAKKRSLWSGPLPAISSWLAANWDTLGLRERNCPISPRLLEGQQTNNSWKLCVISSCLLVIGFCLTFYEVKIEWWWIEWTAHQVSLPTCDTRSQLRCAECSLDKQPPHFVQLVCKL